MTKLKVLLVPVTPFQQNCSIIFNEDTHVGAVVDPGGDVAVILSAIKTSGVKIEKILLTHGHIDHAGGAAELRDALGVGIEGPHLEDKFLLDDLPASGAKYQMKNVMPVRPDRWLVEGDEVTVAGMTFAVLEAPGHTPGSVVFYNAEHKFALMGDVLFKGSIGRTDFPRGDQATLIKSITDKILPLGDDVSFLPGHGEPSTVGQERLTNPYLQG